MPPEVLLVNPPYQEHIYQSRKDAASIDAPLSIGYLAAVLEQNQINVAILDANAHNFDVAMTAEKIAQSSADIVGITSTTTVMPVVYMLIKSVKELAPGKMLVVGGPHVTFVPEQTLKESPSLDMVVRGEGEETLVELVNNDGNPKRICGLTYRNKRRVVNNPPRPQIPDINTLPFPARHLMPMHLYRSGSVLTDGREGFEYASMITSRGCPNKCTYCSSSFFWGNKVRFRSAENVVDEMEFLEQKYGTKEVFFKDDVFTFSPIRTEQICDEIVKRGIGIRWSCYARVNTLRPDILRKMKEAGCYGIDFGIETGNAKILERIKKNTTLEQAERAVAATKKAGIMTYCSFMVGLPGDTTKTVMDTINFAVKLSPDVAQFFVTTPFPGTEVWKEALDKHWIGNIENWGDFDITRGVNYRNDDLTGEEMQRLVTIAYKNFYGRPRFIIQTIKRIIRNPKQFKKCVYGARAVLDLINYGQKVKATNM